MPELTPTARARYEELAAAIDRVGRLGLPDTRPLEADEMIGDYVIVAQVMSAASLDAGTSRYMTVVPNGGGQGAHVLAGLLKIGMEITESGWEAAD